MTTMHMDEYWVRRFEDVGNWEIVHPDRGIVGYVWPETNGKFEAWMQGEETGIRIAEMWTFKAAVEQVIWYDRAMNQEVE